MENQPTLKITLLQQLVPLTQKNRKITAVIKVQTQEKLVHKTAKKKKVPQIPIMIKQTGKLRAVIITKKIKINLMTNKILKI